MNHCERNSLEKDVVATLVQRMMGARYMPVCVIDDYSGQEHSAWSEDDVLKDFSTYEAVIVCFSSSGGDRRHTVTLIPGNGPQVIEDWASSDPDFRRVVRGVRQYAAELFED